MEPSILQQLAVLQNLAPGQKLAVSSTGAITIEDEYVIRNLFRRIRRDGYQATIHALHELVVNTTHVFLQRKEASRTDDVEKWSTQVGNAALSVRTLSNTYLSEGNSEAHDALMTVSTVLLDTSVRFRELAEAPPRKSSSLTRMPYLSSLLLINTSDSLQDAASAGAGTGRESS